LAQGRKGQEGGIKRNTRRKGGGREKKKKKKGEDVRPAARWAESLPIRGGGRKKCLEEEATGKEEGK